MGVQLWVIGVILGTLSNFVSNFGLNMQKLHHVRNANALLEPMSGSVIQTGTNLPRRTSFRSVGSFESSVGPIASVNPVESLQGALNWAQEARNNKSGYATQPLWLFGLLMIIIGAILDFLALGFAAQSLIAPLSSLTLVANTFFAPLFINEKLESRDVLATLVIITGSVLAVVFISHNEHALSLEQLYHLYTLTRFHVYVGILIPLMFFVWLINYYLMHLRETVYMWYIEKMARIHRFLLPALAGMVGAQSVLMAKSFSILLISMVKGEGNIFVHPQSYLVICTMACTIFLQIKWLNTALSLFDALYVVPVFQSFWMLVSIVAGMIFFGEYKAVINGGGYHTFFFFFGIVLTLVGVCVLTLRQAHNASQIQREIAAHESIGNKLSPLLEGDYSAPAYSIGSSTSTRPSMRQPSMRGEVTYV